MAINFKVNVVNINEQPWVQPVSAIITIDGNPFPNVNTATQAVANNTTIAVTIAATGYTTILRNVDVYDEDIVFNMMMMPVAPGADVSDTYFSVIKNGDPSCLCYDLYQTANAAFGGPNYWTINTFAIFPATVIASATYPPDDFTLKVGTHCFPASGSYTVVLTSTKPGGVTKYYTADVDVTECIVPILGCTYPAATNFNPAATEDDGSCIFPGCPPVGPGSTTIANNCNNITIDGEPIEECCNSCVNVGQELCVNVNVGYPNRLLNIKQSIAGVGFLIGGYGIDLTFLTTFTVVNNPGNNGIYTFVSSSYNAGTDETIFFVVQVGSVTTNSGVVGQITDIAPCDNTTHVLIENITTGQILVHDHILNTNPYVQSYCQTINSLGTYKITVTATDCLGTEECINELKACYNYSIVKQSCDKYFVYDKQTNPLKINTVTITGISDPAYTAQYVFDTNNVNFVEITVPADGVYKVSISNDITPDISEFIIYETCQLSACIKKMVLNIFCNNNDPCCNNCDDVKRLQIERERTELNKIIALYTNLSLFIEKDIVDNLGIFIIDNDRLMEITSIAGLFTKINEITLRCGKCDPVLKIVNNSNTGCQSC